MKKNILLGLSFILIMTACTKKIKDNTLASTTNQKPPQIVVQKTEKQQKPIDTIIDFNKLKRSDQNKTTNRSIPDSIVSDQFQQSIPRQQQSEQMSFRNVYFDFDSAALRLESINTLTADLLRKNSIQQRKQLIINGYCDPRGGIAYNYLLGMRRAENVKQHLISLGYQVTLIKINSFGKSKATGVDEKSWQQDRRVEIVVQ